MTPFRRWQALPLSFRVPAIVALLMVVISAAISERVLDRLSRTQESYLDGLAGTYLDGLSSSVLPAVLRGDVWEVFDALDRSSSVYESLLPIETVVTGADGRVLAASDPNKIEAYSELASGIRFAVRHRSRDDRRRQADRLRAPRTRLSRSADRHDPCDIRRIASVCRAARNSRHTSRDERGRRRSSLRLGASCSSAA